MLHKFQSLFFYLCSDFSVLFGRYRCWSTRQLLSRRCRLMPFLSAQYLKYFRRFLLLILNLWYYRATIAVIFGVIYVRKIFLALMASICYRKILETLKYYDVTWSFSPGNWNNHENTYQKITQWLKTLFCNIESIICCVLVYHFTLFLLLCQTLNHFKVALTVCMGQFKI